MTTADEQFRFLCGDFESIWDALAPLSGAQAPSRGNFILANHAMLMLEWCANIADKNALGAAQHPAHSFEHELRQLQPRYFESLPAPIVYTRSKPLEFFTRNAATVIAVVFDLVRNGLSHTNTDLCWPLVDGSATSAFEVAIVGVPPPEDAAKIGCASPAPLSCENPKKPHLAFTETTDRVFMMFYAGLAFTHIKAAAEKAGLPSLAKPASQTSTHRAVAQQAQLVAALSAKFVRYP